MNHLLEQAPATDLAAQWRNHADANNPAGALYAGGEFAETDIIGSTNIGTNCAMCTGSIQHTIRILCA